MTLATSEDVEARLGRPLTESEQGRVEGLLEEASALVVGHLKQTPDPVPDTVAIVTSRIVARVLVTGAAGGTTVIPNATRVDGTKGPFSGSVTFAEGTTSGGPWLSKQDRLMLAPFRKMSRAGSVATTTFVRTRDGRPRI